MFESLSDNPHASSIALIEPKSFARALFARVMEEVDVPKRMRECFTREGMRLQVDSHVYDLTSFSRVALVAVGKAAVPMARHAFDVLRSSLPMSGVVVGTGDFNPPKGVTYFAGGHPLPDKQSFAAGNALLELMRHADEGTLAIFLISGGASAMAETPFDKSISHATMTEFYRVLLHSGLAIEKTNALRKHISAIKGGRLALASNGATCCTVLISDVPSGMSDVVGSGISLPDSSTAEHCRQLLDETPLLASVPEEIKAFFKRTPETPKYLPQGRFASLCFSALSSDSMIEAARTFATGAGYRAVVDNTCDDWDYREAAGYLLGRTLREAQLDGPVCMISAGEVTVSINGEVGMGGRNQQWALETAKLIQNTPGIVALSAGSDGIDGNSPAAGAVVDSSTWARALKAGANPQEALDRFDTYPLFLRLEDALVPGPSGNNLRDLRVLVTYL